MTFWIAVSITRYPCRGQSRLLMVCFETPGFHPNWAVDSSYSWNMHCFQIRWRSHRSAGIGIEKQHGKPSQCCNESGKYCRRLQQMTKSYRSIVSYSNLERVLQRQNGPGPCCSLVFKFNYLKNIYLEDHYIMNTERTFCWCLPEHFVALFIIIC